MKGEAVALAYSLMNTAQLMSSDHNFCARVKRVIMERDVYPRKWGQGPVATEKKKLKEAGKLDVRCSSISVVGLQCAEKGVADSILEIRTHK